MIEQQNKRTDAVDFHSSLAGEWERKYLENSSFITREKIFSSIMYNVVHENGIWLDAGCGTGRFARALIKSGAAKVIGIDGSSDMISVAKRLAFADKLFDRITFIKCSKLTQLDYVDESFDGVFCSSVLEYLDSPELVLGEFWRILKPGGRLVITLPNRYSLIRITENLFFALTRWLSDNPKLRYLEFVKNQYSAKQAFIMLNASKFRVIQIEFGGLGIGPAWVDRNKFWGPLIFIVADKINKP